MINQVKYKRSEFLVLEFINKNEFFYLQDIIELLKNENVNETSMASKICKNLTNKHIIIGIGMFKSKKKFMII